MDDPAKRDGLDVPSGNLPASSCPSAFLSGDEGVLLATVY